MQGMSERNEYPASAGTSYGSCEIDSANCLNRLGRDEMSLAFICEKRDPVASGGAALGMALGVSGWCASCGISA